MKLWERLKNKMLENLSQKVCEDNAEMTFEELVVFAEQFSRRLQGIRCCAIHCRSEMAAAMALLSCFAAGVTALPLSERYGERHCVRILETISPDAVITDEDGTFHILHIADADYSEPAVHPALIMCTSGTSGVPKGVMLTEENVITNVSDIAEYFHIGSDDSILIARPLYHCAVLIGEFLTALFRGTQIRFYSDSFNPPMVMKLIKQYEITAVCGTPTLLRMAARFKRDEDTIRHIGISGECMSFETGLEIAKAFCNAEIYHIYGLTEAGPRAAYLPPNQFSRYADCVGLPLRSVSLKIVKANGESADPNEIGMLWVRGGSVMAGYYNDPEKTDEVLKDGWLCTGDLALFNEVGLLKIKGRSDDLIIKAGMNIYPQEIESALKSDARVREALVRGEYDDRLGTQIVLTISGDFADASEVKSLCKASLPAYQVPSKIILVDEIPKNGSGKIIRRKRND